MMRDEIRSDQAFLRPTDARIGIRVRIPQGVRMHEDAHVDPCLTLLYTHASQAALIDTLERAIEAIRRGPKR